MLSQCSGLERVAMSMIRIICLTATANAFAIKDGRDQSEHKGSQFVLQDGSPEQSNGEHPLFLQKDAIEYFRVAEGEGAALHRRSHAGKSTGAKINDLDRALLKKPFGKSSTDDVKPEEDGSMHTEDRTPKKQSAKPEIKEKQFEEPEIVRLRRQAKMAAAMNDYKKKHAHSKKEEVADEAAEKEALDALNDLEKKDADKEPMEKNLKDYEHVQESMSGDSAEMVSAEAAAANGAAVTAHDLAKMSGGAQGEDVGTNGSAKAFQGDMVPASKKQLLLFQTAFSGNQTPGVAAGKAWPDGIVKYCFAKDIPKPVKHIFEAATRQYHRAVPCISFQELQTVKGNSMDISEDQECSESPAIFVQSHPYEGCYSYVGVDDSRPSQKLQLNMPACLSMGTAIHELGHAMGMAHEQARSDREEHLTIHWDNMQSGKANNFAIDENAYTDEDYDVLSIMHYDAFAFSANDEKTLEVKAHQAGKVMGQRTGLSELDVSQLVAMYNRSGANCQNNALAGLGCVDEVGLQGQDVCSDLTKCTPQGVQHCCACGGGMKVQCYQGQPCPQTKRLDMDIARCMTDATQQIPPSQRGGVPCIYANSCDFPVEFSCSGGCFNVAAPKQYSAIQCNGAWVTDVCTAKDKCSFSKHVNPR